MDSGPAEDLAEESPPPVAGAAVEGPPADGVAPDGGSPDGGAPDGGAPDGVGLMDAGYFERMYAIEETHWWHVARRRLVLDLIARAFPGRTDLRLLDVGTGTGRMLEEFSRIGTATGLDLDDDALRFCRRRSVPCGLLKANLLALPFPDGTFDAVVALDVIEHIEDHVGALREVARTLRPGGRVFIFVPAHQWLWSLQDEISHHVRRYTAPTLRDAVAAAGFQIERLSYFNTFLMPAVVLGRLWLKVQLRYREISDESALHPSWSNGLLRWIFCREVTILRRTDLPTGASLLCVARTPVAEADGVGGLPAGAERLRSRTHTREARIARIARALPSFPSPTFAIAAVLTTVVLMAWGVYLLSDQWQCLQLYTAAALAVVALAVSSEKMRPPALGPIRSLAVRLARPGWLNAVVAAAVPVVLAAGVWYRLRTWPSLHEEGDSPDYLRMAFVAATTHHYFTLPWRTPGYTLPLTWIYTLAGVGNAVVVHWWQILLSLLTAVLMMAATLHITKSRALALAALLAGSLLLPLAAPSGFLMSEGQAVFLSTLGVALVLAVYARRHTGAAMLALGPVLALAYETRPALLPWVAALGLAALCAVAAGWRQRVVLVAGALVTLAPIAVLNSASAYHTTSVGTEVNAVPGNLIEDRFSVYFTAPDSPALLEQMYGAIVTDGGDTAYWLKVRPANLPAFNQSQLNLMQQFVRGHTASYAELSLRRAALLYRYDQEFDMTYGGATGKRPWLLLVDLLAALAIVAVATWTRRRRWPFVALLAGLVVISTIPLSVFHVEPRYSLPALPVIVVLALMGVHSLVRVARAAVAPLRPARLAIAAGAAIAVVLSVPAAEAWFWPWVAGAYAAKPAAGTYELASCYVGRQLLTSVAVQPGTSLVVAGGANGMAIWNPRSGGCPWESVPLDNEWDLDFSKDGSRLAVACYNARIVDTKTWRPYPPPVATQYWSALGTEVLSASFDPTGDQVAFTATGFHFVGVYDLASRKTIFTAKLPVSPVAIRWSPDGSTIAVGAADNVVRLYDAFLQPLGQLRVRREVTALAWSPDGGTLVAGDVAGSLYRWDLNDGLQAAPTIVDAAHGAAVRSLAFSPDGGSLASAGSDGLTMIWSGDGTRLTRVLRGDTAAVWGVAWSSDSRRVVTASADGSIGLWAAR